MADTDRQRQPSSTVYQLTSAVQAVVQFLPGLSQPVHLPGGHFQAVTLLCFLQFMPGGQLHGHFMPGLPEPGQRDDPTEVSAGLKTVVQGLDRHRKRTALREMRAEAARKHWHQMQAAR